MSGRVTASANITAVHVPDMLAKKCAGYSRTWSQYDWEERAGKKEHDNEGSTKGYTTVATIKEARGRAKDENGLCAGGNSKSYPRSPRCRWGKAVNEGVDEAVDP